MSLSCRERPPVKCPDEILRHSCTVPVEASYKELGVGISIFCRWQPVPECCRVVVGLVGRQSGIQCNAQGWCRRRSLRFPERLGRRRSLRFNVWFYSRELIRYRIALAVRRRGGCCRDVFRWRFRRWCTRGDIRLWLFGGKPAGCRTAISNILGTCRLIAPERCQFP